MHIMIIEIYNHTNMHSFNFSMFDWSGKNRNKSGKVREKSGSFHILCEWQP